MRTLQFRLKALVMVVDRYGKHLLGVILAHHIEVQHRLDFGRLDQLESPRGRIRRRCTLAQLAVDDGLADIDTGITDIDPGRARDDLAHFRLGFPAEAAEGHFGGAGHGGLRIVGSLKGNAKATDGL